MRLRLDSIHIRGYRPFGDFHASLGSLEVLVGANGSGKSSLFEFLRFLRNSLQQDIPPEIVPGSLGQQIFHRPGPEVFGWELGIGRSKPPFLLRYEGELLGPVGQVRILDEVVDAVSAGGDETVRLLVLRPEGDAAVGMMREPGGETQAIMVRRRNQLALSLATNPRLEALYELREYILGWRFYGSFHLATDKVRRPVPIEQEPLLNEDGGNLSALLHYLYTEHPVAFDALQQHLRSAVPGFQRLSVKARGGPGQVMAFWREEGVEEDLSLADLSDGTLRLLCWIALCVQPDPPPLICIDEPDQGVHPRTLPLLGGLFEKASDRSQILLATHASYFLLQFDLTRIAVLRREMGEAKFYKPADSEALSRRPWSLPLMRLLRKGSR
jgi:predicted ATPase